jgi:hypothetical protein
VKITVPAVLIAVIVAIPFSLNTYASKSKSIALSQEHELKYPKMVGLTDPNAYRAPKLAPDAGSPIQQPEDVIPETILFDAKGDFEIDKRIVSSSAYEEKINGKHTQVVTGHFRVFDGDGSGKFTDDTQDGVIAVLIIEDGKRDYNVYHSPQKHGELKIVSVKDKNIFSLVAADGTKFTFDLKSRTVTQVQ